MISFASAPGNLFNRLGKLGLLIAELGNYQQTQLSNQTDTTNGAVAQFNSEPDIQAIIGSSYLANLSSPESIGGTCQQVASATFNRMVYRDNPMPGQTLTSGNLALNINEVIRQMRLAGATLLAQTVTASGADFNGYGDGVVVASIIRPFDGRTMQNAFAESVQLVCTADSYSGGATAGNETISIAGDGSQPDLFAFNWPQGSGSSTQVQAIDGDANNNSGNLLNNSGFNDWTNNVPDNFSLVVGAAGTNIREETTIVYSGGASLALVGDGAGTLTELTQEFNSSSGSSSTLSQQTQYSFNVWMRGGSTSPSAGVLQISLVDQNNVVLQDANGIDNSFTFNLTSLNTVYTAFNGVFRTGVILPNQIFLRIKLTTALGNGEVVYLDRMSMGRMTQLYNSGPFYAVHSGNDNFVLGDFATSIVTNSRGAGGTLNTFQTLLTRMCPVILTNGFLFPTSNTPTISDNLIS